MTGPYADWGDWLAEWPDGDLTAQEKREAIAAVVTDVLGDGWSVYASPPPVVSVPAVVIAPQGAYRKDVTFEKEGVMVSLRIVTHVGDLDGIDTVMDLLVRGAQPVLDIPSVTQLAIAGVQTATLANGGDVLVGSIDMTVS